MSHFNYIITCHNSEALIERVLHGIFECCSSPGAIYCVLDGCTDGTERLVRNHPGVHIVFAPDIHELRSINAGLESAPQDDDGYNIILQDDVILRDPDLESKIEKLYATIPNLGYVSFRLGFNLGWEAWSNEPPYPYFPQVDEIESVYGAGVAGQSLMPGRFAYRTVPIKSPTCLPCRLVREHGMLNENLAPYAYDDTELAIRLTAAGYQNGVFSIPFFSDVRWGGSRKPGHPDIGVLTRRNGALIREWWSQQLKHICSMPQRTDEVQVIPSTREANEAAMVQWEASKALLKELNP